MPPSAVWAVLSDGWLYPVWVVGAARMREVDDDWPAVGSRLHHSVGIWPVLIDDNTEVLESEPDRLLRLRTRGWLDEDAVEGPGSYVPKPFRTPVLAWRNTETLRRLCFVVENRQEEIA
jgi:hypothetical protein